MKGNQQNTLYAKAERASLDELMSQHEIFKNNVTLVDVTNSVSQMLVILNKERQIIFANEHFRKLLKITNEQEYIGKRPGEAVGCIHSIQTKGGCGTTEFCRTCGAVNSILEAQSGVQSIKECSISVENNDALDLQVTATPYKLNDEDFTIFVITDISNEKRRSILERVFFHDVLNSAGGISGLSNIMNDIKDPVEISEISQMIHRSSNNLINEIHSQRQLSEAESGDLKLNYTESGSISILKQLAELYSKHEITAGKYISINKEAENFNFETDLVLTLRILGNMLKNAIEASMQGSIITLSALKTESGFVFSVHNNSYIERQIQLQLFKRSCTTKGVGRGIGTYSMKLFGEKYLKGKVWFESILEKGTTFFLEIPKKES